MKLWKPWQSKSEKPPLTEDEEIAETEKMLRKTKWQVDINLKAARLSPNGIAILRSQMLDMVVQQVKEDIQKAKAKGEALTTDKFMAKVDKIQGIYEFYRKVDISKEDIRAKAEEIIKQEASK